MRSWISDFRYAWRKLFGRSGAGGTLVAILSIGLGVGVSAAIFGAVDQILLSALPYPEPQRVIVLTDRNNDDEPLPVAYGTFLEVVQRNRSFEALAVVSRWQPSLTGSGEPARLAGDLVSPDYFAALGVRPSLGRDFAVADDVTGAPLVVIVTASFAERRFGSAEAVLDRTIMLDGESYTVIGVMPEGFENALSPAVEAWAPLRYLTGQPFESREWGHNLRMVGRLREGVTLEQAQREMLAIGSTPVAGFPRPTTHAAMQRGLALESLHASVTSGVRPALLVILGAVLLLLAIACANVTNILLARALARSDELATRAALGAEPGRLVRQLFAENALLTCVGGALGIGIAALASRALVALAPADLPRLDAIGLDARVLGFALATTAAVALVAGLWPALRARAIGSLAAPRTGRRATGHAFATLRKSLVVAQVALATVLLAGAGLLLRSVDQLLSVPTGFDAERVLTMQVVVPRGAVNGEAEGLALLERVLEAVRALPGVDEVALTSLLPLSGSSFEMYGVFSESTAGSSENAGVAFRYSVTPGWFETMGIPLLRGRLLGTDDRPGGPQAILINESFAARRFAGGDPIGERVKIGPFNRGDGPWGTIVGVVGDVKQTSLVESTDAFYVALGQWAWADPVQSLAVQTTGDPAAFVEPIKRAIWSVNPILPIERITTMSALVADSEAQR